MNHSQGEGLFGPITPSPMADSFGIVIHGFNETVVDPEIKIGKDSLLMSSNHPSKIPERFDSAVSCPQEPAFQTLGSPASTFLVPELSKQFFGQISFDNFQVHLKEVT